MQGYLLYSPFVKVSLKAMLKFFVEFMPRQKASIKDGRRTKQESQTIIININNQISFYKYEYQQ